MYIYIYIYIYILYIYIYVYIYIYIFISNSFLDSWIRRIEWDRYGCQIMILIIIFRSDTNNDLI